MGKINCDTGKYTDSHLEWASAYLKSHRVISLSKHYFAPQMLFCRNGGVAVKSHNLLKGSFLRQAKKGKA
eukprot:1156093-Pelagomonas_calceolata.AAC.7